MFLPIGKEFRPGMTFQIAKTAVVQFRHVYYFFFRKSKDICDNICSLARSYKRRRIYLSNPLASQRFSSFFNLLASYLSQGILIVRARTQNLFNNMFCLSVTQYK